VQVTGNPVLPNERSTATALVVDDEPLVAGMLAEHLRVEGYRAETLHDLGGMRDRLEGAPPGVVLLDLQLPDGDGLEILPRLRELWPETPVIVMTGHGSVKSAVRAMRMGAFNYVEKPLNLEALSVTIRKAVDLSRLVHRAQEEHRRNQARFAFDRIVAESPAMRRVLEEARIVADSRTTSVLLLGESGTGKGLLAGALHYASARAPHPFLKVTCSAIPEPLLEAEMFGHEKGAFTDAKQQRRGVFETANLGTVLLDEIGDMPPSLQAKLLGVIEDRAFSRVGGTRRIEVDVRIIAATHRDLESAVEQGCFREDLLYRLKVVPVVIPALRDRVEDILPLAEGFLADFNREFGKRVGSFSERAARYLRSHTWPGNVRELRNVVERAMLFAKGDRITEDDLRIEMGYRPRRTQVQRLGKRILLPPEGLDLEEVTGDLVRQALEQARGNQTRAAAMLNISRDQFRYRLEKLGLLRKPPRPQDESGLSG